MLGVRLNVAMELKIAIAMNIGTRATPAAALEDAALEDAALEDAALEDAALEDAAIKDNVPRKNCSIVRVNVRKERVIVEARVTADV